MGSKNSKNKGVPQHQNYSQQNQEQSKNKNDSALKGGRIQEEAYYHELVLNDNFGNDFGPKEKVQINIGIKNGLIGARYSAQIYISTDHNLKNSKLVGRTKEEVVDQDGILNFSDFFLLDYFFEKQQFLSVAVFKQGAQSNVSCTMGKIMGSRGQIVFLSINERDSNSEQLVLSGHAVQNNNMSVCFDFTFYFKSKSSGLFYIIKKVKGVNVNSQNFLPTDYWKILKSQIIAVGMNPTKFPSQRIQSMFLCNGNLDHPIQIEIHSTSSRACEGVINTTVNQLISGGSFFEFGDVKVEVRTSVAKEYTFLDYLRGGVQISLSIGIDFTGSNGHPRDHNSLHAINNSGAQNQYQSAIRACGDILAYYDYDQLFPVYGYGAILPNSGRNVNHCFPLSLNNEINVKTIDGVLEVYRNNMPKLDFSGPTYFSPLLNQVINSIKANPDPNVYNILLILTDGIINDMDATINALVEGSYLPLSVITVGVGNANFEDMDVLDADGNERLVDMYGRKAARDLNQFVPFMKFKGNQQRLAEEVLYEIPSQLVDYYRSINQAPRDPIIISKD